MDFIKKLFESKSGEKSNETKIIYKSEMPDFIDSANKIYNKEYDSTISDLRKQLEKASPIDFENLSMIHINLMQAYFKSRDANPDYFDLSTHHASEAFKYGHNSGLAQFIIETTNSKILNTMKKILLFLILTNLIVGCDLLNPKAKIYRPEKGKTIEEIIDNELATKKRNDTIFLDFRFGMTEKEFDKHLRKLINQEKLYTDPLSNFIVYDLIYPILQVKICNYLILRAINF